MFEPRHRPAVAKRAALPRPLEMGDVGGSAIVRRLLVVDDDSTFCDALRSSLTESGYRVDCSHSVADAAKRVEQSAFDLLIADLFMPNNQCLEWLRVVAADHPSCRLP